MYVFLSGSCLSDADCIVYSIFSLDIWKRKKTFIGLDKGAVSGKYFSYFSTKAYVVGTH